MELLSKVIQGNSFTLAIQIGESYDMARASKMQLDIDNRTMAHTIDGNVLTVKMSSIETAKLNGPKILTFIVVDNVFGVRKTDVGYFDFVHSDSTFAQNAVNNGVNVIVPIIITEETITIDNVLYNYFKGDSAFRVWQLQDGNAEKTIDDYFDYLMKPAFEAAETAEGATASANYAADRANEVADDMLANIIALGIDENNELYFDVPDNYDGVEFELENGNLIALI